MTQAVFAIPGDKDRHTGGFIYEATVLRVLNEIRVTTQHLQLPDSFPEPTSEDMATTLEALRAVPPDQPIILDGLVFGAIDPEGLSRVKAPVIAMIHHPLGLETGLAPERAAYLRANEAAALRFADHVIVPSPHTAQILAQEFGADPERISVALPGFERPKIERAPRTPPLILSVGLLAERKGHDVLLDALSQIRDLTWEAVIVGKAHDPIVAQNLTNQNARLGLTDRVQFAGELGAQPLEQLFNSAEIFALATRYEGYGMVLSEAMLFGLPIVSCDAGAVSDTVGDAGILTPPDNPTLFAQALRKMLEDPMTLQDYSERSKARGHTLPKWTDTARVFETVLQRLARLSKE
ncbi:MAG: glycosyltransferase family 4 protein [Litoreibacter sp.]|nr:glycosyltransferase family 4 protein [Litoreibacter sp.]